VIIVAVAAALDVVAQTMAGFGFAVLAWLLKRRSSRV